MLFNCFSCGKLVSLKKDLCAYCMVDLNSARMAVEADTKQKQGVRKKHTVFSLLSR